MTDKALVPIVKKEKSSRAIKAVLLAILAGAGGGGWLLSQHVTDTFTALNSRLNTLQQTVRELGALSQTQQHQLMRWQQRESHQQTWVLSDIHLLLLTAQAQIENQEFASALLRLQEAQERLTLIAAPEWEPLTQSLAHDMEILQSKIPIDKQAIWLEWHALEAKIAALPLKNVPQAPPPVISEKGDTWQQQIVAAFKEVVHLRHGEDTAASSETEASLLRLTAQTYLLQAEWALLHEKPTIYQESATHLQEWLQTYYAEDASRDSVLATLSDLQQKAPASQAVTLTSLQTVSALLPRGHP